MKKLAMILMASVMLMSFQRSNDMPSPKEIQGGTITYVGTIGKYKVEFIYSNLHISPDEPYFQYKYTSINVNRGKWIDLKYKGEKNGKEIWKEYIGGKNTGTFTITLTPKRISGTFVNSKGERFNVYAKGDDSDWGYCADPWY